MHKDKTLHPTNIKVTTAQLDGGSNYHVLTNIKLISYIRPVQCNVKILNIIKAPEKGFGLGPAQDVHLFYIRSHLSALQSCELIFLTNF